MFILSLCTVCVSLLLLLLLQSHASTTERNLFGRGCLKPIRLFSPKFCGRGSAERRLRSLIIRLIGNKYQIRELQAVFRSGGFRLFMVLFVVVNVFLSLVLLIFWQGKPLEKEVNPPAGSRMYRLAFLFSIVSIPVPVKPPNR